MVELNQYEQARFNKAIAVTDAQLQVARDLLKENKLPQDGPSVLAIVQILATNYNASVIDATSV